MEMSPQHPTIAPDLSAAAADAVHDRYVSQLNWVISQGRDDLIDVIADEYERRLAPAPAESATAPAESQHTRRAA